MEYNIISTGSHGNAVVIEKFVLIDLGVSFRLLSKVYKSLKLVLLTHIHSDHFNKASIRRLAKERPTLRWGCPQWLVKPLVNLGVSKVNIDVLVPNKTYNYKFCQIIPFTLYHNVQNCGYKLHFSSGKVIYATDTNSMQGIQAKDYDLYMIEANHDEEEIKRKIKEKKEQGLFAYEQLAAQNHLSIQKANDFIYANAGVNSKYVYLHCHQFEEQKQ